MHKRCYQPSCASYPRYGAKGIKVCDEWFSFDVFLADMGFRPEGTSIDRVDGTQGYKPDNCRWATHAEQTANKRKFVPHNARFIEYRGESYPIAVWERRLGLGRGVVRLRLASGWTVEMALSNGVQS